MGRAEYQALYAGPPAQLPAVLRDALPQSVGPRIAVLSVLTAQRAGSDEARSLVRAIRALPVPDGGEVQVTGDTAFDMDNVQFLFDRTPLALAFVMVVTYVVLFFLLGSVILPLKAVVSDLLSVAASFGALVWIFQQGHMRTQLHFIASPIDPSVPVILFCIMFGLSMDYEVLLLSRIKEEYDRHGDNRRAVALGLQHSGGLITGAAVIMVAVFGAFALADSVIIKSIGLGLAIAVAIDATLVRALIVPAVMRLLGGLNWWAPGPLTRLYIRLGLGEAVTRHGVIGLAGSAVEAGADYIHEPRPRSKAVPVGASVGADEEE
jgi:RND superfamily putative drug exporter